MAIIVPIAVASGVIAIAGAIATYYIRYTVVDVKEIVDDTKTGSNVALTGIGLLAAAVGFMFVAPYIFGKK